MVSKPKPEPQVGQVYEKNDPRHRRSDGSGAIGRVESVGLPTMSGRIYVTMEIINRILRGPRETTVSASRLSTTAKSGWKRREDLETSGGFAVCQGADAVDAVARTGL